MTQDEILNLARQYLDDNEYRNFAALMSMLNSNDRNVRAIAESELIPFVDTLIERAEGRNPTPPMRAAMA